MVRTALVVVVLGLALTSCVRFVEHKFEDDHTVDQAFTSVRMHTGGGDVSIRVREGDGKTSIHRVVRHPRDNKPKNVSHRIDGDVLVLDDCGDRCDIDYDIYVPSKDIKALGEVGSGNVTVEGLASVDLKLGSGNVHIRDIPGAVRVDASSGDLTAERLASGLTAKIGSGNVKLDQVKGTSRVESGSGDIDGIGLDGELTADANSGNVELNFVATKGVRVDSGSGDVTVRVPGGPYRVDIRAGSGDEKVDVPTNPQAEHEIRLHAGSGNVSLRPA